MKYLLLIYKSPQAEAEMSPTARDELRRGYGSYGKKLMDTVMKYGELLQPAEAATTVRVRNGQRVITDGPYVETAEYLAGFALIECADLDEALEWAAGHPDARHGGGVEVRPVVDWRPPA